MFPDHRGSRYWAKGDILKLAQENGCDLIRFLVNYQVIIKIQ